jgi:hypothetical protein
MTDDQKSSKTFANFFEKIWFPEVPMFRLLLAALTLIAGPTLADDLLFFHAPSKNIYCMIATGDYAEARCDVMEMTNEIPAPPADCDLDFGHAFSIGPQDTLGMQICAGDSVADPDGATLAYGDSIDLGGFRCMSETTGMTCTNPAGHGFTVAKAKQSLF